MKMDEVIKNNPNFFDDYPIFEIEYNRDGTRKNFYTLASERDIKETSTDAKSTSSFICSSVT